MKLILLLYTFGKIQFLQWIRGGTHFDKQKAIAIATTAPPELDTQLFDAKEVIKKYKEIGSIGNNSRFFLKADTPCGSADEAFKKVNQNSLHPMCNHNTFTCLFICYMII